MEVRATEDSDPCSSPHGSIRTKESLQEEVQRLLDDADERAKKVLLYNVTKALQVFQETEAEVVRIEALLANARDQLQTANYAYTELLQAVPNVVINPEVQDRIDRLRNLIENYGLLFQA